MTGRNEIRPRGLLKINEHLLLSRIDQDLFVNDRVLTTKGLQFGHDDCGQPGCEDCQFTRVPK